MARSCVGVLVLAWALLGGSDASASGVAMLGRSMTIRADPASDESTRVVKIVGRVSDAGEGFLKSPLTHGAILDLYVHGSGPTNASYALPAAGWRRTAHGYRYTPPAGNTSPVRLVVLRRTTDGGGLLSATLSGDVGSDPLEIVPPEAGAFGGMQLQVKRRTYCVELSSALGAVETSATPSRWRIQHATDAINCPCVAAGLTYESFDLDLGASCCGGSERSFPLTPVDTYCGPCLADGYWVVGGGGTSEACAACCTGTCSLSAVQVCGAECIPQEQCTPEQAHLCCVGTLRPSHS